MFIPSRKSLGLPTRVTAMSRSWCRSSALIAEAVSCSFLFSSQSSRATSRRTGWNISMTKVLSTYCSYGIFCINRNNRNHYVPHADRTEIHPALGRNGHTLGYQSYGSPGACFAVRFTKASACRGNRKHPGGGSVQREHQPP